MGDNDYQYQKENDGRIVLVGQPNVGKSAVLTSLSGIQTVVSNYAGTSVELLRGELKIAEQRWEIMDTPGLYSLGLAQSEELITRNIVLAEDTLAIINVVDAGNLARNLVLTLELLELGKPMMVLLNQIDRVRSNGVKIDASKLAYFLGCPVYAFSANTGEGVREVLEAVPRMHTFLPLVSNKEVAGTTIPGGVNACVGNCRQCLLTMEKVDEAEEKVRIRNEKARCLAEQVTLRTAEKKPSFLSKLEQLIDHPGWGVLILIALLFSGFKILLEFISWAEDTIGFLFNPLHKVLSQGISWLIPPGFWHDVLSNGIPEGLLVPLALVMPAIFMVSLMMALLEDTGLLARYAVLLERLGRLLGVSGQAAIPLCLGFGCRVPAVVATRILPSRAQRVIIITLLSIVIPCAATLGMITSVIAVFQVNAIILLLAMISVFLILGFILKLIYGEKGDLIYELPPLRVPRVKNLLTKVKLRFMGFFTEVLPLLIIMSIGVRIILASGWMTQIAGLDSVTRDLFGIPGEAMVAVFLTVIQRYLAPLILLNLTLSPREATIAISMIALSLPCLPVVVMTIREVGSRVLLGIISTGLAVSFLIGFMLNLILT